MTTVTNVCSGIEKRLTSQAFRFELDPNRAQRVLLVKSVGASRFVYNWGLAESKRTHDLTEKWPRLGELKSRLVGLKQVECPWLYEVSAHIGQQALVDLDNAFNRFFKGVRNEGPKSGFPKFKKKGERDSCRVYEVELFEGHIYLPKIGHVRLKERASERGFEGRILSATISRRADRWFVSLAVERERDILLPKPIVGPTDVVGVDLGLKAAAVIYDGVNSRLVEPRQALRKNLVKLRRLDRRLARKQRGSRNREKAKLRRARLYYKISCQRQDFLHHLSSELTRAKSVIVLEDLHVRGIQRNKRLALSVNDAGMGELRRQVTYKSTWYGSRLIVAERLFASTQLCSGCGTLNEQMKGLEALSKRTFNCPACRFSCDRDENAAINLHRYGLNALASELPEGLREVTPVGEEGAGPSTTRVKPSSMKQEAKARRDRDEARRSTSKDVLVRVEAR
jgi:putative transposase